MAAGTLLLVAFAPVASADPFTAQFDPGSGNQWWVEVFVDADAPLAGVDARVDGGEWMPLDATDWGSWAKVTRTHDQSVVEFRAHSTGGETIVSDKYGWPEAEFLACPPGLEAEFRPGAGNEWWVEVRLTANDVITAVDAKVEDGDWRSLERTDWGSWADSFRVEEGSDVRFRATSDDGLMAQSRLFEWPEGEVVGPAPTLDAAFGPKEGNVWWVETYAVAEHPIERVEACIGEGDWHELSFRDWHAWAAAFEARDTTVFFRATDDRGLQDTSPEFHWPSGLPVDDSHESWPREGSYVHYEAAWGVPGLFRNDVDQIFVHHDDQWRMLCEGDGTRVDGIFEYGEFGPPFGPADTAIGEEATVRVLEHCETEDRGLTVDETNEYQTRRDGDTVTVTAWFADDSTRFFHESAAWETSTGLLVEFDERRQEFSNAELQDTDAPMS